jgi:hypothetical protein
MAVLTVGFARHVQHAGPGVQQLVRPDGRANTRYVEVEHETVPPGGQAVGADPDRVAGRHVEYADAAVGSPVVEKQPVDQPDTRPDHQPADHAERDADTAHHHDARTNDARTNHTSTNHDAEHAGTEHDPVDPHDHTIAVEPDRIAHPESVTRPDAKSHRTQCDGDVTDWLSRFGERL